MKKILKNIATTLTIVMFSAMVFSFAAPPTVNAADPPTPPIPCTLPDSDDDFFKFPTWYRGFKDGTKKDANSDCVLNLQGKQLNEIAFTVALNVIDIALRIIAILTVLFTIYGGFLLITAQGAPDKLKSGRTAIIQALTGLAIAMLASFVVSMIVGAMNP
ncbi:hypothetical protein FWF74_01690 [Candidatus Saccharibacteria bacterium]|nr:hypothetical protein [Candidatus Saccharibacteria bacterium]MCL1963388.1 hypothetical protein [Candidatus Saccharibacteria bacterium]